MDTWVRKKMVIEIKTTGAKNLEKWNTYGVPLAYLKQAQLYTYLMKKHIDSAINSYAIVATFVEEEDYANPENYPIEKRLIRTWKYDLDIPTAEDDIEKVKEWYLRYVNSGISPKYNLKKDDELLTWLKCKSVDEWEVLKAQWISDGKIKL